MAVFGKALTKVFGSRNERLIKRYSRIVQQVNQLEQEVSSRTDAELRQRTQELREQIRQGKITPQQVQPEAFAIIRESMDRHIGIREIFNPDQNFDPDQFDDATLNIYDQVQQRMIQNGESYRQVAIPQELYDAVRKLYPDSRPPFRARCFDVQIIGGLVLYEGKIAEMATGEGKTFVAPLACFMKVLEGQHCHVVTVNDYLVRRDALWVTPAFENLGVTVGYIQQQMDPGGQGRKEAYQCDITYGINSEFGFDYLRDNMKERLELQVQGPLDFAIVDEVDSILIDEARTPLIISGAAHDDAPKYRAADAVARKVLELNRPWDAVEKEVDAAMRAIKAAQGDEENARSREDKETARQRVNKAQQQLADAEAKKEGLTQYYEVELDRKSVQLTHEGITAAQEAAGVGSFYVGDNMEWPHLMEQSLRAHVVYERDKDYVVEPGQRSGEMEVVIVDEYTGRKMVGRQWSDGLHQAVEAKERVPIKQETQTLATITLQNFFKLYKGLAGMTGTAMTESEEFMKIYHLEVVNIPTNRPVIRRDSEDLVYRTEAEKWNAIIEEIKTYSEAGRPVLVGTTSVEKSEMLSQMLKRKYGIDHEVLNAKQHEREAQIVTLAGQQHVNAHGELVGNVTIATNMAGRGTDIKPAQEAFWEIQSDKDGDKTKIKQRKSGKVTEIGRDDPLDGVMQLTSGAPVVGGLHVIGTERHTSRRIDNQLRGRSGRQGDPGSSRFFVSLKDPLMAMFMNDWTIKVLGWLGMEEGQAIEDRRISKGILRAQKKVEERHYLGRQSLLDYDEVMDHQRTHFYGLRQQVLEGRQVDQIIWDMIGASIADAVEKYVTQDYVAASIAEWARTNFDVNIDTEDLKGMREPLDLEDYIKGHARNDAKQNITSTLGEFTGESDEDSTDWDVKGLVGWAQSKYGVEIKASEIRSMTPQQLRDPLIDSAVEKINQRDCGGLMRYLEPLYAQRELAGWAHDKFGIDIAPEQLVVDPGRGINKPADQIIALIEEKARQVYHERELSYPIDHVLAMVFGGVAAADDPYVLNQLRGWIKAKWNVDLTLEELQGRDALSLRDQLLGYQQQYLRQGKLEQDIDTIVSAAGADQAQAVTLFNQRFGTRFTLADLQGGQDGDDQQDQQRTGRHKPAKDAAAEGANLRGLLLARGQQVLRLELTSLEQAVLIQIFDQAWKDHLYAMDALKSGIGLQAFAERDPRIAYKQEGYKYFQQMLSGIRDKVTDIIFKVRLNVAQQEPARRSAYQVTSATHQEVAGYGVEGLATPGEAQTNTSSAQDQESAPAVVKTIVRQTPKVGRNDPCPCGSGKKYKKCHGAGVA
ncbi:MAG: preprotein translocase subunit SecA [Phycisphaerales bacterium]|nr:preprotein translocase subunit SecA [Phycisphaerales bacterium]